MSSLLGQKSKIMNNLNEETYYFLLSATRKALIGEIQPCFRGVAVEWLDNTVQLFFYIDGEISEKLRDDCSSLGAEVVASFSRAKIREHIIRLDYPAPLPKRKYWIFRRYENLKRKTFLLKNTEVNIFLFYIVS